MPAVVQAPQPPGSQTLPKCHLSVWGKPFSLHPFQIPIEGHFNLTSHFLEEVKGQKTWSNSQSYNVRRADNSRKKIQCRCFHGGRSGAQALYTVGPCHLCGGVRHQRIKIKSLCALDTSFPKVGDYLPGIMPWNTRRALPLEGPEEWVGGTAALSLSSQTRPRTLAQQLLRRDPEGPEADGHSDPQHCPRGAAPGPAPPPSIQVPWGVQWPWGCSRRQGWDSPSGVAGGA